MNRRDFVKRAGLFSVSMMVGCNGVVTGAKSGVGKKPNIVLFVGDDLTWHDCEPYGSTYVRTPNLKKLADEGMCFDQMHTSTAMCAPTRQQLYTGLFPVRNGAFPNHSKVKDGTRSLFTYMKELGYRVALIGKEHVGPKESFPYEYLGGRSHDGGGNGLDLNVNDITDFVGRDDEQPYCLVVASNQPHSPWNRKLEGADYYKPKDVTVPEYMVDTPVTRQRLCAYYDEITYMDAQLGLCMKIVEESGKRDNTMVLFTSEQGNQFPFGGKWTCYETGLKTGFIVRWPGVVKEGCRNSALTQYVDVVPTLVEAAGGEPSKIDTGCPDAYGKTEMDGVSFMDVLLGKKKEMRQYVYGVHTTRGIFNGSECYPIRSVYDGKYKYIWNLNYQEAFRNIVMNANIIKSWRKKGETDPVAAARAAYYEHRPEVELYDVENDPWEMTNLAGDASLADVKERLRKELVAFMKQQGDEGKATEMTAPKR